LTPSSLTVELYGDFVGELVGTDGRTFDFTTSTETFRNFSLGSTTLSMAVPLEPRPLRNRAARRRNFFAELLPEGRMLSNLASNIRVSEQDVIGLLTHFGRDVAGAIQIYDRERPGEPRNPFITPLTDGDVATLLTDTAASPLGNSAVTGKTSLAGVQEKIVLAESEGSWNQVHDGYPSTHILKPTARDHPTLIFDEEYGGRICHSLGLRETTMHVESFEGTDALVIERYDRDLSSPTGRVHQEDMNQALGASGNQKYQEYGGKVSLQRIAAIFDANDDVESVRRLFAQTVAAVALGNLDMHAKNVSMLHRRDGTSTLAPAYDMVPMRHLSNDGRLALAVGGEYVHAQVSLVDLVVEGESWGVSDAHAQARVILDSIRDAVESFAPDPRAYPQLRQNIEGFVSNLLAGKPAGSLGQI